MELNAKNAGLLEQRYDMIVSNPPYIPVGDANTMEPEVLLYERESALFAGERGLDCIEVLLQVVPELLVSGGSFWLEVDPSHPDEISRMVSTAPGASTAQSTKLATSAQLEVAAFYRDFRGLDRFVQLIRR